MVKSWYNTSPQDEKQPRPETSAGFSGGFRVFPEGIGHSQSLRKLRKSLEVSNVSSETRESETGLAPCYGQAVGHLTWWFFKKFNRRR